MAEIQKKIELLKRIAHRFNENGITWALGASMLLYFKNIVPEFHDIDLMIADEDVALVKKILSEMGEIQPANLNAKYRTKTFLEYVIDGIDVDVMAGFSIVYGEENVDCSLKEEQIVERIDLNGEMIPLQSPELWCQYYRLMGRDAKVKMIQDALREK